MTDIKTTLNDHIVGLAHIGHIVDDLKAAIASFQHIYGVGDDAVFVTPPFDVTTETRFAFIDVGATKFELIEPISDHFKDLLLNAPSGGGGINHVAYEVRDIESALVSLKAISIHPGYVTPDGIVDLGHKKMVYLDPATTGGIYIELIEIVTSP